MSTELRPDDLCRRCEPQALPFATTADEAAPLDLLGQDRAVEAARFAFVMHHPGYNLFALGPEGVGKRTAIRALLAREAASQPTPDDWCLVHDFREPRRPRALRVPPGVGARLRGELERAVVELRRSIPAVFESEEYRTRKQQLVRELQSRQELAFRVLQARARAIRVLVERTDTGVVIAPMREGGPLDADEFSRLPEPEQALLRAALEHAGAALSELFASFRDWSREQTEALHELDRTMTATAARRVFDVVRGGHGERPAVLAYLAEAEADVVDNLGRFLPRPAEDGPEVLRRMLHHDRDERLRRYEVNVIVDHAATRGAPVVIEDNPTLANLVGSVEHVAELGALVTDLTLVRPGALHRANGGYLLVDAARLLQQPLAWPALKRALRTGELRIESVAQATGLTTTTSLDPEPIPLDLKVVLFGDRELQYLLAEADPDFDDLFKVVADFEEELVRTPASEAEYARLIAGLVARERLRPFERGAVARLIDHAARHAGDGGRLSLHMRTLADLAREADHAAGAAGRPHATADDVDAALAGQLRRLGRVRERLLDAIRERTILVETTGARVGQVNGLSVLELGGHAFGRPTRITARARMGEGKVVDIEREVELGGPIHAKGVLILSGLFAGRYGQRQPLALSATIVFEQSYSPVEGDSASLAELCALLSALAEVPIQQSLAVTGSISQLGEVQPIGGVNEKIEGFFDVCRERGLTGDQGVVIPRANLPHLMLRADVVAAVAEGRFHVHAVTDVDEAIELLTGTAAGAPAADGDFPAGSVNALVEARLARFADDARRFAAGHTAARARRPHRWP